jgi:hypothetical protein
VCIPGEGHEDVGHYQQNYGSHGGVADLLQMLTVLQTVARRAPIFEST